MPSVVAAHWPQHNLFCAADLTSSTEKAEQSPRQRVRFEYGTAIPHEIEARIERAFRLPSRKLPHQRVRLAKLLVKRSGKNFPGLGQGTMRELSAELEMSPRQLRFHAERFPAEVLSSRWEKLTEGPDAGDRVWGWRLRWFSTPGADSRKPQYRGLLAGWHSFAQSLRRDCGVFWRACCAWLGAFKGELSAGFYASAPAALRRSPVNKYRSDALTNQALGRFPLDTSDPDLDLNPPLISSVLEGGRAAGATAEAGDVGATAGGGGFEFQGEEGVDEPLTPPPIGPVASDQGATGEQVAPTRQKPVLGQSRVQEEDASHNT